MYEISNTNAYLDSRMLEQRLDDLEDEFEDLKGDKGDIAERARTLYGELLNHDTPEANAAYMNACAELNELADSVIGWLNDYYEEWWDLKAVCEEGRCNSDWFHGVTLIHEGAFAEYAEQFARDIYGDDVFNHWPGNTIDWGCAAEALQQDYTAIEYGDETYWMQA